MGYRGLGGLHDNVHAAGANGSTATLTFTGTGISVIGEGPSGYGTVAYRGKTELGHRVVFKLLVGKIP
ncbi:hypothetical protein AB5J56_10240 [Streptomyces sp. R21]|uniref:Uncharacterized protein n=1 Tax=Streptomyces sp. R21 TaxID=3238627 RepID=A0AB39P3L7_9ACTN